MRVSEEMNIDVLRQKTRILENENERLTTKVTELLREVFELKGMAPAAIELNLTKLVEQAAEQSAPPKRSERRSKGANSDDKKTKQRGHGPTAQPKLEVQDELFDLDEPDKACTSCGGSLTAWEGHDDVVEVVDRIPAAWVIKKCTLKKYRCACGGCVVTADGPAKLIAGGRYALGVGLQSCVDKFVFHIPIERQVRIAALAGMTITSQTLWDQQWALATLFAPLVGRIQAFILSRDVLGADMTGFLHIKKGGALKWQVWQLACPQARFFKMLRSKAAKEGGEVFTIKNDKGSVIVAFKGTAVIDGAAELEKMARELNFKTANCWSHARRNVLKAEAEAPVQVAQFLDLVAVLYKIEREVAGDGVDAAGGYRKQIDLDALRRARAERSKPATRAIQEWILAQKCIPGGALQKGLAYVAGRWTGLTRFLEDPQIPLDNNIAESGFVGLALGRRNYVGCRSERGMTVATTFYTLFESARVCGATPDEYLRYAAEALLARSEPLLPHEWVAHQRLATNAPT